MKRVEAVLGLGAASILATACGSLVFPGLLPFSPLYAINVLSVLTLFGASAASGSENSVREPFMANRINQSVEQTTDDRAWLEIVGKNHVDSLVQILTDEHGFTPVNISPIDSTAK